MLNKVYSLLPVSQRSTHPFFTHTHTFWGVSLELGFCYANGKGTKKDLKLAAKYYRLAAAQGVEMMDSQWIWKDKVRLSLFPFYYRFFFLHRERERELSLSPFLFPSV